MRLRSSAFALIGASLFAMAQPAEDTLNLTKGGLAVAKQFIATRDIKEMEFKYKRPRQSADGFPPDKVKLEIAADNGSPIVVVSISPAAGVLRASQPGDFVTSLEESKCEPTFHS